MIWRRGLDDGGCEWSSSSNRFQQAYVQGFVDVSGGNVLLRAGPTNNNHLILQGGDISLNGRLNVATGTSASVYKDFNGKVPPTTPIPNTISLPTVSPNSTKATSSTWTNNNVTWTSSASNYQTSPALAYPYYLFDTSSNNGSRWTSSNSSGNYSGTTGIYVGTSVGTTILNSVGTQYGEWVQIQSSTPIVMNNFTMSSWSTTTTAYSEMPGAFFICGSTDNTNWYPLIYIKFTGTQISSGQTTPVYTIPSGTSGTVASPTTTGTNVSPSGNLNYATFGNGTNSYFYFRMVITQQMGSITSGGTNDGWLSFSEWTPVFTFFSTAATQTGPSRALIYMDPSNINQVDVSGSLGLINSSPPSTMMVTPNTTAATSSIWNNNNITWQASSASGAENTYQAFNNYYLSQTTMAITWNTNSTTNFYNGSASGGVYAGTTNTPVSIGGAASTNVAGEWLQIQSSVPVVMNNYFFTNQTYNSGGYQYRMPLQYTIAGSNDGNTWVDIQDGSYNAMPITNTGITMPATDGSKTNSTTSYSVSTTTSSASGTTLIQNNNSTITYSTSTASYLYFRIIIKRIFSGIYGTTSSTGSLAGFFWNPTFTPVTSSVSLALDNITPNQLNIGGLLGITGGITPLYSTPSFSAGQIGYSYFAAVTSNISVALNTGAELATISNVPPGVWLVCTCVNYYQSTTNARVKLYVGTSSGTTDVLGVQLLQIVNGDYMGHSASIVYNNTSTNTFYLCMAVNAAGPVKTYSESSRMSFLQMTRIA
jgi:hypothetical protein